MTTPGADVCSPSHPAVGLSRTCDSRTSSASRPRVWTCARGGADLEGLVKLVALEVGKRAVAENSSSGRGVRSWTEHL